MRFGWVLILLAAGLCFVVRGAAPTVQGADDKQLEMMLENSKWLRARLDKVGRRTGVASHAQFPGVGSAVPGGGRASGGSGAGASSSAGRWSVA